MMDRAIDADDFGVARTQDRNRRRHEQRLARAEALRGLHRARDDFHHTTDYPDAAGRDADRLELLADRLVDWSQVLERELGRLEIATDPANPAGGLPLAPSHAPCAANLADALAELVSEHLHHAGASAVMIAAARHASI